MNMKEHILAAMREQYEAWEALLASLGEEKITTPIFDYGWSIQDVIAHLWAWQQISNARVQAGALDRAPEFPAWLDKMNGDWEEDANRTNAFVYDTFHGKAWAEVYQNWRDGYLQLIETAGTIPEQDLLDSDRFPWLKGYPLEAFLVASYSHHQEHLEKLEAWLTE